MWFSSASTSLTIVVYSRLAWWAAANCKMNCLRRTFVWHCLLFVVLLTVIVLLATDMNIKTTRLSRRNLYESDFTESNRTGVIPVKYPTETGRKLQICDTVHLAFIVESTTSTATLLKSILTHRHSPLHFHFILSPFSQTVLQKLMDTWELPYVEYSFYLVNINDFKESISWIPKSHPAKVFKLLLPSILPSTLNRVIFLDNDVTVMSDIQELWGFFDEVQKKNKLIGIANSFGDSKSSELQFFNTDVVLFNLYAARQRNWTDLWHQVIKQSSSLVVEDIISRVAGNDSFLSLPCNWNFDITSYKYRQMCDLNYDDCKIIRWSIPGPITQYATDDSYIVYFRKFKTFIMQYDGNLLRYVPLKCGKIQRKTDTEQDIFITSKNANNDTKICQIFKEQSQTVFRTHLYFYGQKYHPVSDYETTLVTQLSLDRLRTFHMLISQWDGPISISMYGTDFDMWQFSQYVESYNILKNRKNMAIHIVYKQGNFYPVNYLRNIALNAVSTPYVFLDDGDFIPAKSLFSYLKKATKSLLTGSQKRALVIPAFETTRYKLSFPNDKAQLLKLIRLKMVSQFCVGCAHKTHAPTNYRTWFKAKYPYKIQWAFHFEPYVVVRSDVVRYDQRFVGYGYNKVSQITELKAQGYEFVVIPQGFIIHSPHAPTMDKGIWEYTSFKHCLESVWKGFLSELVHKYGVNCLKENKDPPKFITVRI